MWAPLVQSRHPFACYWDEVGADAPPGPALPAQLMTVAQVAVAGSLLRPFGWRLLTAHDDGSLLRFAGQMGWWTRARLAIADIRETVHRERGYRRPFESRRVQVHAWRQRLMSPVVRSGPLQSWALQCWALRSWILQGPRPAHRPPRWTISAPPCWRR
jgi:hypothetical protein